jgi:PD-(D/E)XK nuclease superfamily
VGRVEHRGDARRAAPRGRQGGIGATGLPDRYGGEPVRHLSASSYSLWLSCQDAWRRRYIKGEKPPTTGSMFVGSGVDDALSAYHRRILEHGDRLALDQVLDLCREAWHSELEAEQDEQPIAREEQLSQEAAFELGRQAVELAMAKLVPHLVDPVDVRRRLEFSLAPGFEWTILCYLDLETLRVQPGQEPAPTVVDFKVRGSLIWQDQADADPQAGLYLAGRWLDGYPVFRTVQRSTLTDPERGFARRGASFQGGVPVRSVAYRPAWCAISILPPSTSRGFRPFMVRGDVSAYWTVYDGAYEPVEVADAYLRRLRFGSGKALGTTRMYAGNLALFFEFCVASARSLRKAALEFDRFMHFLWLCLGGCSSSAGCRRSGRARRCVLGAGRAFGVAA